MEYLAAIGVVISLLNGVAFIWLSRSASGKQDQRDIASRLQEIEKQLGTVDNRIMIACHARVKRAGEYWEFHTKVMDALDKLRDQGLLK